MKTLGLLLMVLASAEGSMRGGAAAVDAKGRSALLEAEHAARRLPAEDIPGLKVIADFEKDAAGWVTDCATQAERVVYGAPGVPPPRAGGTGMYRFRANDLACSSFSYKILAGGLEKGVPYHLQVWIWLPQCDCITDFGSINCPYTKFQSDFNEDGSGVLATARAGQWNVITGVVRTEEGTDLTILVKQLPPNVDVYMDDISLTYCSVDNFRTYALPKIDALRKRDVSLTIDAGGKADEVATVTMTRHEYPFGATTTAWELQAHPALKDFFIKHFNTITDEYTQKWVEQEPEEGVFDFVNGDGIYNFAIDNNLDMRGHDIFAEGGGPAWLAALPADGSARSVQSHIWRRLNMLLERYDAKIINYDVVNEITHFNKLITLLPCKADGTGCMCQYKPACDGMGLPLTTPWWTWAWSATRYLLKQRGSGAKKLFQNDFCTGHYCGPHNSPSNMVKLQPVAGNDVYGMQMHQGIAKKMCGFDIHLRVTETTKATPGTSWWFTEYDVDDPDLQQRADGYEMGYLAAYSHAQVEGFMLWGWAKETIAPDQDGRPNTSLIQDFNTMGLNAAGERVFGDNGVLTKAFVSQYTQAVPADGGTLAMRLFKGEYTVTLGACTAQFRVLTDKPVAKKLVWACAPEADPAAALRAARVFDPANPLEEPAPEPEAIKTPPTPTKPPKTGPIAEVGLQPTPTTKPTDPAAKDGANSAAAGIGGRGAGVLALACAAAALLAL